MEIKWLFKSGFRGHKQIYPRESWSKNSAITNLKENLDDSTWKTNEPPMLKEVLLFLDIISNSYLLYIQQTENLPVKSK